jgi:cell shape-determining protein MreD
VLLLLFLRRTMPDSKARLRFAPASLLLVLAAVVFSRITGFQPGIVFGLVAGVVIGATLATAVKARVALIGLGYSFAAGLLAWVAYTIVVAVSGPDSSAGGLFVQETLSAIAIGGMAVLPVALFPLRGMTGYDIFSWNRVVWGAAYALGLVGFFFVLMPMPFAWKGVPFELGVWVGLYLLYAVAAVVIWLAITRPWDKKAKAAAA